MHEKKEKAVNALVESLTLGGSAHECVALAGLGSGLVVVFGAGCRTMVEVQEQLLVDAAQLLGEKHVLMGHSHPTEVVEPSLDDLTGTRAANDVLRRLHIELVEHVIVGGGQRYLMSERDPDLWEILLNRRS